MKQTVVVLGSNPKSAIAGAAKPSGSKDGSVKLPSWPSAGVIWWKGSNRSEDQDAEPLAGRTGF